MSVSMSGLELGGGEGVLGGSSFKDGDTDETGMGVKVGVTLEAEGGVSRGGGLGEARVSNAWIVSSEDGEILGPVDRVVAAGSKSGFLEGVVTNLMTEGAGSLGDFFSANFSAGFSIFIDLKCFRLEEFKELRVKEEYKPECM